MNAIRRHVRHLPRWYIVQMTAVVVAGALALVLRACTVLVTMPEIDVAAVIRRHLAAIAGREQP